MLIFKTLLFIRKTLLSNMNPLLEKEDHLLQIREKLRKDGIKLWLPPYFTNLNIPSEEDLKKLAEDYCSSLKISFETCYNTIKELQNHSLENLKQRNLYEESGLATIKVKILCKNAPKIVTKEMLLSISTNDLKLMIKQDLNVAVDSIKLIYSGKVLNDRDSLSQQGLKNGQQVLAIILTESPTQIIDNENQIRELENTKTDSRLLALDNEYMQLEDQFGNAIKIPPEEKKALVVAMALHEKGKTVLKRKDYSRALVFFLEADQEFRRCNSQLLNTVDNYALLDLDIAWCYLCLESFIHLPEAHIRLKRCEEKFHSTYGTNLERVIAVKGTPGNEEALLLRLHLLQAIVLYHQSKREEALKLLKKVENDINNLKVDEHGIMALIELGFTPAEATMGLRAMKGDVNLAASYINENREKRAQSRKKAQAEAVLEKEKKKLGKCADGKQYIDPHFLKILVGMGYNKETARQALRETNNVISDSVQYIQEHPVPGPSSTKSRELLALIQDRIPELEEAGFDPRMAKLALEMYSGDIVKAVEELLSNNGIVSGDLSGIITSESLENIKKKRLEDEQKDEAFKRLKEDITMVDDDYLDIDLIDEERFLLQYLSLLEK